ncbi:hypothetical protein SAMN05660649_05136 [Desulfotomaculum arcticum]|uniref:Uncharacterized protein n=1 Tax=Desulfotruncus arcticus DSM 17038 TaxID=1121424 RepID=A0A1I2ZVE7_9FIRM|nr:hypothetical protein [Desulfotruncus arcticus]SFH41882.1 hypothetical protein SAMN05660649_05136 [Desulfotomaculum arcticum] [Desulfotruncus arcticus DSM 17038]
MESKNIKELVIPTPGYTTHVKNVINNFKKTINRVIPRRQEENLKKLASLFLNKVKVDKPIVVNLDIGEGKSTLLLEFIKYIYEIDKDFSTVIVKKTLQEGREFCINAGIKDIEFTRGLLEWSIDLKKELENLYYGDIEKYKEYGFADEFPQEDIFIARLLRGFNYKDCVEYEDPNEKKNFIGKMPDHYREYSPVLCKNCTRTCGAKLSRWTVANHPVMVITHQRLFLSNDLDKIADSISGRKVLIIDEKIETKDIGDVLLDQWEAILTKVGKSSLSDGVKEQFNKIGSYLNQLQYPERSDGSIVKISPYDPKFEFDATVYGIFMDDYEDIETLVAVEKFINYGGTTSRNWRKDDKKQFSYIRYIDLENYTKHFEKTIILDATSARNGEVLDEDYKKSNVVFLNGLNKMTHGKINLYYSPQKTTKSSLMYKNNIKTDKSKEQYRSYIGDRNFYLMNVELIAQEVQDIINSTNEKTLIICYKLIVDKYGNEFNFENDFNEMLKFLKLDSKLFSVRHFGAATTGVNDFREYKNIVFIGMLNKGELYYTNKTIAIGSGSSKVTALNEYLIDCIQQIGRICIREGKDVNVYMLFEDRLGLIKGLTKHYSLKRMNWLPKYFNGINNATISKQGGCWFAIINELKKMKEGDIKSLKSLQDALKSRSKPFQPDTVYRYVQHIQVKNFMAIQSITYNKAEKIFKKNLPKARKK